MIYEEDKIKSAIEMVCSENRKLSVDVGCGTGRAVFCFHHMFSKNIGIDFSTKMIEVCRAKIQKNKISNVDLKIVDINVDGLKALELADETVSFVNLGFGMGSFIEDIENFKEQLLQCLTHKAIVHISFYNKHSIANKTGLSKEMGFQATCDVTNNILTVASDTKNYTIPCMYYSVQEVEDIFSDQFEIVDMTTYPTVLALLKYEFSKDKRIMSLCAEIDEKIASNSDGYYISCILRKK
jgi:SAM-dependent methyltransferase